MESRQKIRFDIETSKMRRDWAIAERERSGGTPALETFIKESDNELAELADKLLKPVRRTRMPAKSAG
jgi:hypothetical protein